METFISTQRKPAGEASPGEHDDLLMPLAIAVYVALEEPDTIEESGNWGNPHEIENIGRQALEEASQLFSTVQHPVANHDEGDLEGILARTVPWRDYGWRDEPGRARPAPQADDEFTMIDRYT